MSSPNNNKGTPLDKKSGSIIGYLTWFTKFWLAVLVCMGVIFSASSQTASSIPNLFSFQDIAFHFFIYSILALFFYRALKNTFLGVSMLRALFFTVVFCVFYSLTDEWHQVFVPGRCASGFDVFIDSIGSFTGSLSAFFFQRFITVKRKRG